MQRALDESERRNQQKIKQIAIVQQQVADSKCSLETNHAVKRRHIETNQSVIQQNMALQKYVSEIKNDSISKMKENERLKLEVHSLKSKIDELNNVMVKLYQTTPRYIQSVEREQGICPPSPRPVEEQRNEPAKPLSLSISAYLRPMRQTSSISPRHTQVSVNLEQDEMEDVVVSSPKEVPKLVAKVPEPIQRSAAATAPPAEEEPADSKQVTKRAKPKRTRITGVVTPNTDCQDEIVFKNNEEEEIEQEAVIKLEINQSGRRSARQRGPVSYAEPSLRSKLRRGYENTFGVDPGDINIVYKYSETKKAT